MNLDAFSARLVEAGIDPAVVLQHGAQPLLAHAARHTQDAGPWLEVLARYVDALKRMEAGYWAPLRFCVPQLAEVSGADPACFGALLGKVERLLEVVAARTSDWVRTQEYGIPTASEALVCSPEALHRTLDFALALAEQGAAPGWLLQLAIPKLWQAVDHRPGAFSGLLDVLERTARSLHGAEIHVGYPFATCIAALASQTAVGEHFEAWLEPVRRMGRSLATSKLLPYATFEYGVPGLVFAGPTPPAELTAALELGAILADLGMDPARVLNRSGHAPWGAPLSTGRFAQLGMALARDGVDPYFPLAFGAPAVAQIEGRIGEAAGEALLTRVMDLARVLHAAELPSQQIFTDGFESLLVLEERFEGIFERGLALAEYLTPRGHRAGPSLTPGLARALRRVPPGHPAVDLCFEAATGLADVGADPFPLLAYAFSALWDLADGDAARLKSMLASLERLVATLVREGIDAHAVLFHDMTGLAEAGGEAHAFIDLLGRVERLFEALRAAGIDPAPMSATALPTAAREATGRPWLLVLALEAAQHLAEQGQDPAPLFGQPLEALGKAAGQDADAFTPLLRSLEQRFRRLPPELLGPATTAACQLAGTRTEVLDEVLGRLAERFAARAPSATDAHLIAALPLLAEAADAPASLFELIEATQRALEALADTPRALEAWVRHGLPAVPSISVDDPRAALALIPRLAELASRLEPRALALETGASVIARACVGEPERFLTHLLEVDAAARRLASGDPPTTDLARRLRATLEVAQSAGRGPGDFPAALRQLLGILERHRADPALPELLEGALRVSALHPLAWSRLVSPAFAAQARPAAVLGALEAILRWHLQADSELQLLHEIITQEGVRAADILRKLILPALRMGALRDLERDRERLMRFIRDVGLFEPTVWSEYRRIWDTEDLSEREKQARSSSLVSKLSRLTEHLREGTLSAEDEQDPLLGAALMRTFPPAVASGQERALAICRCFPDHPEHLNDRDPGPSLRSRIYRLARGSWQLRTQMELDGGAWTPAVEALAALPEPVAAVELGWRLLTAWGEGRIGRDGVRRPLLSQVLTRLKAAGVALPAGARTATELIGLRELLADRCRDGVEEALLAARAETPERYERLIRAKLLPRPKVGPGLVRGVRQTLEAARGGKLPKDEAAARLEGQLHAFAFDAEALLSLPSVAPAEIRAVLEALPPRDQPLAPGKEVGRLHADFLGQDVQRMQEALFGGVGRPGCLEYRLASEAVEVRFEPTKRKAHAAVGLNEGVCVAEDLRLWDTSTFLQLILWSTDGVAQGGVHLLIVEDEGGGRLALPGINPSRALLEDVGTAPILDAVVDCAWRLARAWGLVGVWLPAQPWIHSNRSEIHQEIAARAWPTRGVRLHPFSYSPYTYSFNEVLEVPERYLPEQATPQA